MTFSSSLRFNHAHKTHSLCSELRLIEIATTLSPVKVRRRGAAHPVIQTFLARADCIVESGGIGLPRRVYLRSNYRAERPSTHACLPRRSGKSPGRGGPKIPPLLRNRRSRRFQLMASGHASWHASSLPILRQELDQQVISIRLELKRRYAYSRGGVKRLEARCLDIGGLNAASGGRGGGRPWAEEVGVLRILTERSQERGRGFGLLGLRPGCAWCCGVRGPRGAWAG